MNPSHLPGKIMTWVFIELLNVVQFVDNLLRTWVDWLEAALDCLLGGIAFAKFLGVI
jgi:hypothetical protein